MKQNHIRQVMIYKHYAWVDLTGEKLEYSSD